MADASNSDHSTNAGFAPLLAGFRGGGASIQPSEARLIVGGESGLDIKPHRHSLAEAGDDSFALEDDTPWRREPLCMRCARVVACVPLSLALLACLWYASGGFFIVTGVFRTAGWLPPQDSTLWAVMFPFNGVVLHRNASAFAPGANRAAGIDELPFFAEAVPFFLFAVVLEVLIFAVRWPKKRAYRVNDSLNSLSLGLLSQLTGVFFRATSLLPYEWVFSHKVCDVPDTWWGWMLALIGVDFGYYWFHRASHSNTIFWGQHVVHHSSEEYNLTTSLRQPALGGIAFVFYLPLALAGLPLQLVQAHIAFNLLYQFWLHTALVDRLGPLEWVLNTPSHHRVHHGRNPRCITDGGRNYGGTLIIWDRLFGTFEDEHAGEPVVYGIIPPLKSWNPVWANLHSYWDLLKCMWSTPGVLRKVGYLVHSPAWRWDVKRQRMRVSKPPRLGTQVNPSGVWNPYVPGVVAAYALIQFAVLIVCFFGVRMHQWDLQESAIVTAFFAVSLVSLGALLELRWWALYGEVGRLCIFAIAVVFTVSRKEPQRTLVFDLPLWVPLAIAGASTLALVSIAFCLREAPAAPRRNRVPLLRGLGGRQSAGARAQVFVRRGRVFKPKLGIIAESSRESIGSAVN